MYLILFLIVDAVFIRDNDFVLIFHLLFPSAADRFMVGARYMSMLSCGPV